MEPEPGKDESFRRASGRQRTSARENTAPSVYHRPNGKCHRESREREIIRCDGIGAMCILVKLNVKTYNRTIVFPPIDFSKVNDEELAVKRSRELNNGRLAMIAIMSFVSAANIPGAVPALTGNPMF